ncbi:helicase Swr1p [Diutina catenulata]
MTARRTRPKRGGESRSARPAPPPPAKRRKLDVPATLSAIMTRHALAANELFQLQEYKSVLYWDPEALSRAVHPTGLPEAFDEFERAHQLHWEQEEPEDISDLPLRLQKKRLAEREAALAEKYPFKADVERRSHQRELELMGGLTADVPPKPAAPKKQAPKKPTTKPKARPSRRPVVSDSEEDSEEYEEEDIEVDFEEADFDDDQPVEEIPDRAPEPPEVFRFDSLPPSKKFRSVTYSLAKPIVTHPSHVPGWNPTADGASMDHPTVDHGLYVDGIRIDSAESTPIPSGAMSKTESKVIPFEPMHIRVRKTRAGEEYDPEGVVSQRLAAFLRNYKSGIVEEASAGDLMPVDEYEQLLRDQAAMVARVRALSGPDGVLQLKGDRVDRRKVQLPAPTNLRPNDDPFRAALAVTPRRPHTATNPQNVTFHDHFIAQAVSFAQIHQSMRKQHVYRTRRIAQMVEQHFRKKAGEAERLIRERDQNLRRISRMAMQAVKKRWSQANKVYQYMQHEQEEELKKLKGRQHLSQMLEHSTQLLEQQLMTPSSRDATEASGASAASDDASGQDGSDSGSESGSSDSENFSSSSDDDGQDEGQDDVREDDAKLSVEELRQKYAALPTEPTPESPESVSESEPESEPKPSLAALLGDAADDDDEEADIDSSQASDDEMMSSSDDEAMAGDEPDNQRDNESDGQPDAQLVGQPDNQPVEVNGSMVRDVALPSLLRGTLRPYQKQGLNWLASLYNNNTNGILADEMGLGKTIQTISLLAYLACEHHDWGPHLIIVPTSVMLNWEMEFKKFAPGFKVLTYYGSPQERARKRKGWNKPDTFHVCITSYQLVVHDHSSFKRRRWKYMILDEAHNIKNFRSTRWRALLNMNTEHRLLLTGTPLQNNLMELWSLLYFLMPSSKANQAMPDGFANLEDFQQWFGKPVDRILEQATALGGNPDLVDDDARTTHKLDQETRDTVARLHQVLRPYILRRLKKDVEKQMPAKYEHIVYCRLSKRQRFLYDDFMSRAKTKETLRSGNFLSIINCLMQLRKVCNHPDLFEVRPVVTSYAMAPVVAPYRVTAAAAAVEPGTARVNLEVLNLDLVNQFGIDADVAAATARLSSSKALRAQAAELDALVTQAELDEEDTVVGAHQRLRLHDQIALRSRLLQAAYLNDLRCQRRPVYSARLLERLTVVKPFAVAPELPQDLVLSMEARAAMLRPELEQFAVVTPAIVALDLDKELVPVATQQRVYQEVAQHHIDNPFHFAQTKLSIGFPEKSLLQYDCGKLQKLAVLLQQLIAGGHRALIFTQMTKVLDILEQFLNINGYLYMRLDGATKIEDRQLLTEKFNRDPKIPVFILSTRSGGLGINLTGADTVIFYDSDWNPAMDKQCQDRCHRIGQSRDVHIYRFVSEYTIESNILRKANQKRQLDNVVIQEGEFTTDFLGKFSVRDLVEDSVAATDDLPAEALAPQPGNINTLLAQAEDEEDRSAANEAMKEVAIDDEDFNENAVPPSSSATPGPEAPVATDADVDYAEGVGHIDEYMIKFISNELYTD